MRKKTRISSSVKQTNAKKKVYKGINFRSELEVFMFKEFEKSKIPFAYEAQKFTIIDPFESPNDSYERFLNGKGEFKNRGGKKYSASVYTPDFTPPIKKPLDWVVEVKGRSMPDFPRTWRLFKKKLSEDGLDTVLFMPRNQGECKEVINLINNLYANKSK